MISRLVRRAFNTLIDRPLPRPGEKELALIAELRKTCAETPPFESAGAQQSQAEWLENMNQLRQLVLLRDPREFLRWDVVSKTMFISDAPYIRTELKHLQRLPDWSARWKGSIRESSAGHPIHYLHHPASSANLIHHAYHVARFEELSRTPAPAVDLIFEFGGGYGSMCRLFHQLGFRGTYIIFDLPLFSALQRYYLQTLGLPVLTGDALLGGSKAGIACVHDLERLTDLLSQRGAEEKSLFLATWSLSESPLSVRGPIMPLVKDFKSFLIAYQHRFGEVDNVRFFEAWKKDVRNILWNSWNIDHIPGNSYLMGVPVP